MTLLFFYPIFFIFTKLLLLSIVFKLVSFKRTTNMRSGCSYLARAWGPHWVRLDRKSGPLNIPMIDAEDSALDTEWHQIRNFPFYTRLTCSREIRLSSVWIPSVFCANPFNWAVLVGLRRTPFMFTALPHTVDRPKITTVSPRYIVGFNCHGRPDLNTQLLTPEFLLPNVPRILNLKCVKMNVNMFALGESMLKHNYRGIDKFC